MVMILSPSAIMNWELAIVRCSIQIRGDPNKQGSLSALALLHSFLSDTTPSCSSLWFTEYATCLVYTLFLLCLTSILNAPDCFSIYNTMYCRHDIELQLQFNTQYQFITHVARQMTPHCAGEPVHRSFLPNSRCDVSAPQKECLTSSNMAGRQSCYPAVTA